MKKVWILRINSESGDDYGCWVYSSDNKPNQKEIDRVCATLQEEKQYLHTDIIEADFVS